MHSELTEQLLGRNACIELHLGILAHVVGNPFLGGTSSLEILPKGGLLIQDGRILDLGPRDELLRRFPFAAVTDHGGAWLLPGMVDGHVHAPQFFATTSYGKQLMDWLHDSIFTAEARLVEPDYARACADAFVSHLLKHGTTTALVFGPQFTHALGALFDSAERQGLRLLSGLTLMDRDAPQVLLTTPQRAYDQSLAFIEQLRSKPRAHYAITPRFALSCSPALLEACGQLKREAPECFVQTHINESSGEIEATLKAFPQARNYLDIYAKAGLLAPHTVLAHSIYSTSEELAVMGQSGASVCHCPCSNLYLGSGLFPMQRHLSAAIPLCVGTDIGGGANFGLLRELADVYKVQQLQHLTLDAARLLYLGTLGGAVALGLDHETGNFTPGKSADFFILDPSVDSYLVRRLEHCSSLEQQLFVLINQADARHIRASGVHAKPT